MAENSSTDCCGCIHLFGDELGWTCNLGRDLMSGAMDIPEPIEPCVHYDDGSGGDSRDDA